MSQFEAHTEIVCSTAPANEKSNRCGPRAMSVGQYIGQ